MKKAPCALLQRELFHFVDYHQERDAKRLPANKSASA